MLLKRFAFPALYISFLVPVLLGSPLLFKSIVIVVTVALSFYLNRPLALRMALLLVLALGTLIPLLALVQGAACWIPLNPFGALFRCVADSSRAVVLNAAVLGVAAMLLVTNEWRGSMLDTVNGLYLPREVRLVAIVAGAMIGEFERSTNRVHQAFTCRGESLPAVSWRNGLVLPAMLAVIWAAVLSSASARLEEQWASDAFWNGYIPKTKDSIGTMTGRDIVISLGCILLLATSILLVGGA